MTPSMKNLTRVSSLLGKASHYDSLSEQGDSPCHILRVSSHLDLLSVEGESL